MEDEGVSVEPNTGVIRLGTLGWEENRGDQCEKWREKSTHGIHLTVPRRGITRKEPHEDTANRIRFRSTDGAS